MKATIDGKKCTILSAEPALTITFFNEKEETWDHANEILLYYPTIKFHGTEISITGFCHIKDRAFEMKTYIVSSLKKE